MKSIEKIALRFGVFTFLGLSAYFGLMMLFDIIHIIELRVLNAAIMFGGCFMAIRYARNHLGDFGYLQGMAVGSLTGIIASILFAGFGVIYLNFIDPEFMLEIQQNELFGSYLNKVTANIQIFMEGTGSAVVISLMIMQIYKPGLESNAGVN